MPVKPTFILKTVNGLIYEPETVRFVVYSEMLCFTYVVLKNSTIKSTPEAIKTIPQVRVVPRDKLRFKEWLDYYKIGYNPEDFEGK